MTRRLLAAVVLAWSLAATAAPAQEKYTLKLKSAAEGDSYTVTKSSTGKDNIKLVDADGNALKETPIPSGYAFAFTDTILKKGPEAKRPSSLRRTYTKAETVKDGKTVTLEMEGKTVLIERRVNTYIFRYEDGGEVTGESAKQLEREFQGRHDTLGTDAALLPKEAVAVGDTWPVVGERLKQTMKEEDAKLYDFAKARATGKLLRAYKKDGRQFAVMEFAIELPFNENVEIEPGYKLNNGKVTVKGTMDVCVDGSSFVGSSQFTMTSQARGRLNIDCMDFTLSVAGSQTSQQSQGDGPKKK